MLLEMPKLVDMDDSLDFTEAIATPSERLLECIAGVGANGTTTGFRRGSRALCVLEEMIVVLCFESRRRNERRSVLTGRSQCIVVCAAAAAAAGGCWRARCGGGGCVVDTLKVGLDDVAVAMHRKGGR